jgi:hypothetical protein
MLLRALAVVAAGALLATPASAHGFGQRYDLPLPLSFYLVGAAAAVAVSFLIVGLFVREVARPRPRPGIDLLATPLGRWIASPTIVYALKLLALAAFIVTIVAGLRGDQNPYRNIAPTMVWIVWWIGLAYVSAFLGNLWAVINPWRTVFAAVETIYRGITGRAELSLRLPYPAALGVWPAFVLLLAFAWLELVYPNPALPRLIAWLAIGYTVLTVAGMFLFGRDHWLARGEVFTLVFGTFARFAPMAIGTGAQRELRARPFGAGLIDGAVSTSLMAFVLLLLATVLYDGALGTPEWGRLEAAVATSLSGSGDHKLMAIRTAGLIAFWLVLFGAYVGTGAAMSAMTAARLSPLAMARRFALALVPIAIGYHVAHYLTFLLIQGQYIIPLISDPFGFGWNVFGTAGYRVDIGLIDARFAWYAAVAAILVGHIAAVYLAHCEAMQVFDVRATALRSQVPLTALMVIYTFVSLSILAEPLVERRTPAPPSEVAADVAIPEQAVLPEPGTGRLQPVGAGKVARQKLTYRAMGSAFHDGTRMSTADLAYAYMFAYRWGADGPAADPLVAAATAVMRMRLLGVRFLGADSSSKSYRIGDFEVTRELHVVEVYTSIHPVDPEQDAVAAPPWSTLPWHLLVLMEEAVMRGWGAFSHGEAQRRGTEWLDLVRSPELGKRLAALVDTFARDGYRPEPLAGLVDVEDARKRWAALAAFHRERGHFLVANGPYQLKRWSAGSVTLEAFRDLSYPLGVGSYDAYAVPRRGFITKMERDNERIRVSGDIELIQKHMRSYDIVRRPLASIAADVLKRAAPECRYLVTDGDGRVVLAGQVALAVGAGFLIDLTGKVPAGRFTLAAQIIVNGNAMNAEIQRIPIDVAAKP